MSETRVLVLVLLKAIICSLLLAISPSSKGQEPSSFRADRTLWEAKDVEHAFGLPDTKPRKDGTLILTSQSLTFVTKTSNTSIPRGTITAVRAGNERIELWGMAGRIIRMAMPDGAGLLAATMTHHRVGMMTIEFVDNRGGMHSAVFYLPPAEADAALGVFGKGTFASRRPTEPTCGSNSVDPKSVLVKLPDMRKAEVPDAYQALLYEHAIDRLQKVVGVNKVYRYGEIRPGSPCPQYTIKLAMEAFRRGNQVVRASTGPIGMLAGATQMTVSVSYLSSTGVPVKTEQLKASVRTESESANVADATARKLAKQFASLIKANGNPVEPRAVSK